MVFRERWFKTHRCAISPRWGFTCADLLAYCRMDTLEMVKVLGVLYRTVYVGLDQVFGDP